MIQRSVDCIDCFDGFKSLKDNSFDYVLTSPPYNRKRNDKYANYDDDVNWYELLTKTVENSFRVLKDDGFLLLNIQCNYYNKVDYYSFLGEYARKISQMIVWEKSNPMPTSGRNITNAYEVILAMNKHGQSLRGGHTYTKNIFTTKVNSRNKYSKIHGAVMNEEACDKIFDDFIGENKSVLDPFSGLGTTGVCAIKHHCSFKGFEIDSQYAELANERINECSDVFKTKE